jgi:glucokinase
VPCEYGHTKVPPRGSAQRDAALETQLLDWLSAQLYSGGQHAIEYEDIVSGRGIVWCYRFLLHVGSPGDANRTAADIAKAAAAGDATCQRALQWHYEYLLRCCGQIAVGTQAKGVLLCGDNQFNNGAFIASHIAPLREAFADTAKRDWLDDVAVLSQKQELNANLLGCARVAAQCAAEGAAWEQTNRLKSQR